MSETRDAIAVCTTCRTLYYDPVPLVCVESPNERDSYLCVSCAAGLIQSYQLSVDRLQALTTQQAWNMRSLELTVENLRAEVERLREVLGQ